MGHGCKITPRTPALGELVALRREWMDAVHKEDARRAIAETALPSDQALPSNQTLHGRKSKGPRQYELLQFAALVALVLLTPVALVLIVLLTL